MDIRLNKFISDSGYCSRRDADRMIEKKKVTINRRPATLGDRVKAGDEVRVNGNLLENNTERMVYIALNKPEGITSTTDRADKSNVLDFIHFPLRVFHIGRLDKDSEGLLLLTNDGDIVNKILRAGNQHEKEYEVWVNKPIEGSFIEKMAGGVEILGTRTKRCKVEKEGTHKFRITLTQGLNRQIRRMCEALGYEVELLRRVRIMNISLGSLPLGDYRLIEGAELEELFSMLKDSDGGEKASRGAGAKVKKRFYAAPTKGNNTKETTAAPRPARRDRGQSKAATSRKNQTFRKK